MIEHHPEDEFLVALAAGRLDAGQSLVVSVHLESCGACRGRLHTLQAVGGALLAAAAPKPLAPDALAATLARLDAVPSSAPRRERPERRTLARPELPGGASWPASLGACAVSRWHWMGPGMRWSRVALPYAAPGSIFLLRIPPGRSLPRHTHKGIELTQVLCGTFDDGRAVFGPGDFDATDEDVHHQPVVQAGSECVCLAYVADRLEFDGRIAGMIGRAIGM